MRAPSEYQYSHADGSEGRQRGAGEPDGDPGDGAPYIDPAKCTGCGECANVCPVLMPDEFNQGLADWHAAYRLYPQAIPSAFGIRKLDRAPCTLTCPAEINVQGYVQLVKMGKYEEAVKLIMERLPLPGVLGRVCPHPCESKCRRGEMDEPVSICSLKRFAVDQVDLNGFFLRPWWRRNPRRLPSSARALRA